MKKYLTILAILTLAPLLVFAQVVSADVTDAEVFQKFFSLITEYKTLGSLALAAGVVQLLLMVLKAPLANKLFTKLDGQIKLILVTFLSIAAGLLAAVMSGMSFGDAFWAGSNLAAVQVFLHQVYLKFYAKKPTV